MSFSTSGNSLPHRFSQVHASFLQKPGLAFSEALSEGTIQAAFDAEGVDFAQEEDGIFTPEITLWAWLGQSLYKGEGGPSSQLQQSSVSMP